MKQEQDKELDLLLQQHAKRESLRAKIGVSVDKKNGEKAFVVSEHLDADAMNAYAENVLPVSTRMRYATHLVACDVCRKLITQLALTANPIGLEKKEDAVVSSVTSSQTWREWFLSLFTLPNLKVAGPVAAVLCVAAVTFIAWQRRDELPSSVSQIRQVRDEEISPSFPKFGGEDKTKTTNTNVANAPKPTNSSTQNSSTSGATTTTSEPSKSGGETRTESPKKDAAPGSPETERKDAPKEADKDKKQVAVSAPSPSQAQSGPMANQNQINQQAPTNLAGRTQTQSKPTTAKGGGPSRDSRDASERSRQNTNEEQTAAGSADATANKAENKPADKDEKNAKSTQAKQADEDDSKESVAKKKTAPAPTRSIGGKQFRRQGNIWIDTAYNGSSRTDIKRGSDEYRSLDSGLRSIAEQLSGEVIVVWKSKAYRIY
jgi:hypothetical protein